jgi:soluble lytic murein transglycosylase
VSTPNTPAGILTVSVCLLFLVFVQSAHGQIEDQRRLFLKTSKALDLNRLSDFESGLIQLKDYPLLPYLKYEQIKKNLRNVSSDEVRKFLETYQSYPFAYHLRNNWLNLLAKQNKWREYLVFFDNRENTRLQCHAFQARLKLNLTDNIEKEIEKVWLRGYSQPDECDPAFNYLLQHTPGNEKLIWSRIKKAYHSRRPALARYLAKKLPADQHKIADLWYRAHKRPEKTVKDMLEAGINPDSYPIVVHGLDRLARKNSLIALNLWDIVKRKYSFSQSQQDQIAQRIALSAAYQHLPEAADLLVKLPEHLKNDQAFLWLARIQLREQNWSDLQSTIQSMPDRLRSENEWQYWFARSIEKTGSMSESMDLFSKLASTSSYYGFLASDKVKQGYTITQEDVFISADIDESVFLENNPYLLRARELFFVNRLVEAKREWFQALRLMTSIQIKQAAVLASRWKWHDSAIRTVAKTSHRSDYSLRFPMPYKNLVMDHAKNNKLDPSVIYGVMRRESLFDPFAKSRVGALGLMQLMPSTARYVAKSLGLKKPQQYDILNINNNIKLGTHYFSSVMGRFDDNVALAAAAYNAGPGNVKKWLPKKKVLPADLWIETVPFKETRNYVQAVLAYSTVFDKSFGRDTLISSRMGDVRSSY